MTGPLPKSLSNLLLTRTLATRGLYECRTDIAKFISRCVRDDHGNLLGLAPMHLYWLQHVEWCWARGLRCMILAHFGSGKSSALAVPLIAFMLGQDPQLRVKQICNDDSSAKRRVGSAKQIFESENFRVAFPDARPGPKWTDHELILVRKGHSIEPSLHARGVFTTGIGGRADRIVCDDVVDQKNSMDEAQRKKVRSLLEETWFSRLEPDGQVLWIGTVWNLADATHHFMKQPGWCVLVQKISDDCNLIEQEVVVGPEHRPAYPIELKALAG